MQSFPVSRPCFRKCPDRLSSVLFLRSRLYFQSPCRLHDLGFIAEGLKFSGNIFIDKQVFQLIIGTMRQFCRKQCVQVIPYCDTQNVTLEGMLHLIYIPLRDM